ncbi:MAG: hypothetical protein IJR99_08595 [Kiritimatiellae bacterium]|nr:hypothetical protein [Kiritimatiellia bacterium]
MRMNGTVKKRVIVAVAVAIVTFKGLVALTGDSVARSMSGIISPVFGDSFSGIFALFYPKTSFWEKFPTSVLTKDTRNDKKCSFQESSSF